MTIIMMWKAIGLFLVLMASLCYMQLAFNKNYHWNTVCMHLGMIFSLLALIVAIMV